MKVLLTGANGFLGNVIKKRIEREHTLLTLGRTGGDFEIDITHKVTPFSQLFDMVIHCAGKAHSIPKTERQKQAFYDVNFWGTKNLLRALSTQPPVSFVFISTVAVYGRNKGSLITEDHPLQGGSPYADSKIKAEEAVREWCKLNHVTGLILRLPLIAGASPPGNLGKMIRGIEKGRYLRIAGGKAHRSVVLAEDVAECILKNPDKPGIFNLTDGYHPAFSELEEVVANQLGKSVPPNIPLPVARFLGWIGDIIPGFPVGSSTIDKMVSDLTFDDQKARAQLGWNPRQVTKHLRI